MNDRRANGHGGAARPSVATHLTVFVTALGRCGIVWRGGRICGVQLPETSDRATRARLAALFPEAREGVPPAYVARVMEGITGLLGGRPADLTGVPLDMTQLSTFHRRVYTAARAIPPGSTRTYGEVARRAGYPGSARAVGQAMARNPFAPVVPCHRVVAAGGRVGGFSAAGGVATKARLLAIEAAVGSRPALPLIIANPLDGR